LLQSDAKDVRPFGFDNGGHWFPIGLNEVFKFSRYKDKQQFKPHLDAPFVRSGLVLPVVPVGLSSGCVDSLAGIRTSAACTQS
jgi:hypothetical protein